MRLTRTSALALLLIGCEGGIQVKHDCTLAWTPGCPEQSAVRHAYAPLTVNVYNATTMPTDPTQPFLAFPVQVQPHDPSCGSELPFTPPSWRLLPQQAKAFDGSLSNTCDSVLFNLNPDWIDMNCTLEIDANASGYTEQWTNRGIDTDCTFDQSSFTITYNTVLGSQRKR
jgi:hypothetical protein